MCLFNVQFQFDSVGILSEYSDFPQVHQFSDQSAFPTKVYQRMHACKSTSIINLKIKKNKSEVVLVELLGVAVVNL